MKKSVAQMDIDTDHKKFHASVPWRRYDSAKRKSNELQGTLDPNKKYHQRKPIAIRLNEQRNTI